MLRSIAAAVMAVAALGVGLMAHEQYPIAATISYVLAGGLAAVAAVDVRSALKAKRTGKRQRGLLPSGMGWLKVAAGVIVTLIAFRFLGPRVAVGAGLATLALTAVDIVRARFEPVPEPLPEAPLAREIAMAGDRMKVLADQMVDHPIREICIACGTRARSIAGLIEAGTVPTPVEAVRLREWLRLGREAAEAYIRIRRVPKATNPQLASTLQRGLVELEAALDRQAEAWAQGHRLEVEVRMATLELAVKQI
ncbi:MAG: hypothetical protein U1E45_20590 [Geminicoccaceae bacterium]